jgi:hypothetical protein
MDVIMSHPFFPLMLVGLAVLPTFIAIARRVDDYPPKKR